jgi:two-component system nitrogen regulation response regulator GlnG
VLATLPEAAVAVAVSAPAFEASTGRESSREASPVSDAALASAAQQVSPLAVGGPALGAAPVAWPIGASGSSGTSGSSSLNGLSGDWEHDLEVEAMALLVSGRTDVWDALTRRFESKLIQAALLNTRGRRIEAAQKLGIGRNTITRKIQDLGLE